MTTFDKAVEHTLQHEGGYINDTDDPGGATNHGISLRFLRSIGELDYFDFDHDGDLTPIDVKNLTKKQAKEIYKEYFWNDLYYDLPQELATKIFDLSVNMGTKQAVTILQKDLGCRPYDGIYGVKTHRFTLTSRKETLENLRNNAVKFYYNLASKRPTAKKYLFGWMRRAYS